MARKSLKNKKERRVDDKTAKVARKSKKTVSQQVLPSSPSAIKRLADELVTAFTTASLKKRARPKPTDDSSSTESSSENSAGESDGNEDPDAPSSSKAVEAKQQKKKKAGSSSKTATKRLTKAPPKKKAKVQTKKAKAASLLAVRVNSSDENASAKTSSPPVATPRRARRHELGADSADSADEVNGSPSGDDGTAAEESASVTRPKARKNKEPPQVASQKALSYCGDVPLNHLARSFVLPTSLIEKQVMKAFVVIGETDSDADVALLAPDRAVIPNIDNLDGLINLSRLTHAERYSYVRRLVSAAQVDQQLRANVRLCMLVNARSCSDIFYLILRKFDLALLVSEKTPVDNFCTQLFNYLEILFGQRWFLMRPGKLTRTELWFYGQRGENFKKYVRYVELFFARPKEFYQLLEDTVQSGLVSGQDVAKCMLQKFGTEDGNLKAWYAMQHRATIRANGSRRHEMDMIPDVEKNWIGHNDEDAVEILNEFTRSYSDARSTDDAHWLDDYPSEQNMTPEEFTRLMNLCHCTISRKIYTNKALSVSARRINFHLAEEVKCSDFLTVAGADKSIQSLAQNLGRLTLDDAHLELASASADLWVAKFQFLCESTDDAQTSAIKLQLPIANTAPFKDHLLNIIYHSVAVAESSVAQSPELIASETTQAVIVDAAATSLASVDTASGSAPTLAAAAASPVVLHPGNAATQWTTHSLRDQWESAPPSLRTAEKTLVFMDADDHNLTELRERLLHQLASALDGQLDHVDNDVATALLHEVTVGYMNRRPHDVVVTVNEGFWDLETTTLDRFEPIQLLDSLKCSLSISSARCLVGFSTLGDHRVLGAAFGPDGIRLTPDKLTAHCSIVILGCFDNDVALKRAFVAAQVQLARTLSSSAADLLSAHWTAANCIALATIPSDLDEEAATVLLTQQFLRLLYFSTLPTGPSLRMAVIEEVDSSNRLLQVVHARLAQAQLVSILSTRSVQEDEWQQQMETEVKNLFKSNTGGNDTVALNSEYNTEIGLLVLRTLLLLGRNNPIASNYMLFGRITSEFGGASTALLNNHQRELQTWPQLGPCLEYRTLTLHGYVPLGIATRAWLFSDGDDCSFVYNPRSLSYWRDGVQLQRESLLQKRSVNLPYM